MDRLKKTPEPELLPLGQSAVMVRFSTMASAGVTGAVQAFRAEIEHAGIKGVTDVVGSLNSVFLQFDPQIVARHEVITRLRESLLARDWLRTPMPEPIRRWTIPVRFGGEQGPQLAEAAELAGVSEARAIQEIVDTDLRVLAIGFAPGQPYLGLLPENWDFPRQSHLTPRVPAGAVAVAVSQLVLFANASKTGWRQVGQAGFRPFKPDRSEPFLLRQGDALRFVQASADEVSGYLEDSPDGLGGARCEVLR